MFGGNCSQPTTEKAPCGKKNKIIHLIFTYKKFKQNKKKYNSSFFKDWIKLNGHRHRLQSLHFVIFDLSGKKRNFSGISLVIPHHSSELTQQ